MSKNKEEKIAIFKRNKMCYTTIRNEKIEVKTSDKTKRNEKSSS